MATTAVDVLPYAELSSMEETTSADEWRTTARAGHPGCSPYARLGSGILAAARGLTRWRAECRGGGGACNPSRRS
jgi:hypothetical protein